MTTASNSGTTVLRGGRAVLPERGLVACDLVLRNGRIAEILAPGAARIADTTILINELVVLPGVVDAHIHLGHGHDVSRPRLAADAIEESGAAAAGGVTCFISYLQSPGPFEAIFDDVIAITGAGARTDFAFHFIIATEDHLAGIKRYVADYGVPTFKFMMTSRGGDGARLGLPDIDDGTLFRLCEAAAEHHGMVCPHPENIEISWVLRDRVKKSDPDGRGGLRNWNATRPPFVEAEAVQRAALLARHAGAPIYIVHTTSAEALKAGLAQRQAGACLFIETCPHYLTHDVTWEGGDIGKINPPLREPQDREALWQGLLCGDIDTVATDHVHRDVSAKAGGIWKASPGCPGMETLLPVLISEGHHKRGLGFERIAELTARNPARAMGLNAKGSIAVGMDADLAVIDPGESWLVDPATIRSGAGYSIYEGWTLKGRVIHTLVRGRFVLREKELDDEAIGHGKFVRRVLSHDAATRVNSQTVTSPRAQRSATAP